MKAIFILEGKLNESNQCALSEAMDVLAKDWGLSSYLDDVLEDDVCEHNNTITNECSDCNEQELKDACYNANCDKCGKLGSFLDGSICGIGKGNTEKCLCIECINMEKL